MAGNPVVEPALDLGGQVKNFDGHGLSPLQVRSPFERPTSPADAPDFLFLSMIFSEDPFFLDHAGASELDIVYRTDRFQYLLFNIT